MARYTSKSEFMHDFASSATAQIPHDKWTSTALRTEKREQRETFRRLSYLSSKEYQKKQFEFQKYRERQDKLIGKMFTDVARRVQKEHPELSWFKARTYARTKDPVGRMIRRMEHTHSAEEIKEAISKIGRTKKASSGRSSG